MAPSDTDPAAAPPPAGGAAASWADTLGALWNELPGLVNDRIELLSLELHRAGSALWQIVVLTVVAAILAVTAWLMLWGVAVLGLMAFGLHPAWALAVVLGVNVAASAWAVARLKRLLPALRLPATRRHLMIHPRPPEPGTEAAGAAAAREEWRGREAHARPAGL